MFDDIPGISVRAGALDENERGLTIDEIAERLALSRTTIYYWVSDLPISRAGRANEGQRRGNDAMQRKYRLLGEAAYGKASRPSTSYRRTRAFATSYVFTSRRNRVAIGNSDAAVVRLALSWISRLIDKSPSFWSQHHADQNVAELRAFWAELLRVDPGEIRQQRKSNSAQLKGRHWRSRHGVLGVAVGDTLLRARLRAWMDCLKDNWATQ
jgi:AcrR family transcriptional regulator